MARLVFGSSMKVSGGHAFCSTHLLADRAHITSLNRSRFTWISWCDYDEWRSIQTFLTLVSMSIGKAARQIATRWLKSIGARHDTLGQWAHELDWSQRHGQRVISAREILIMIVWTGSLASVLPGLLRDRAGYFMAVLTFEKRRIRRLRRVLREVGKTNR